MSDKKTDKKEEGAKKGPPILIIAIAIVVIGLVAAFVMVKKASAKGDDTKKEKKIEPGPVLPLDEFLVNLADSGGDHFLKVTVNLELDKSKGKTPETMKEQVAPVRDAILTSLCGKTRDEVAPIKGREKLKAEIKEKVNAILGDEIVQRVFFTNFVTQ